MEIVSQWLVYTLICFPILAALTMIFFKDGKTRKVLIYIFAAIIAVLSLLLIFLNINTKTIYIPLDSFVVSILDYTCLAIGFLIAVVIIVYAVKHKNILAIILAVLQFAITILLDLFFVPNVESVQNYLYFDAFSLLMVFIIGVVGSGICVYAIGYMHDHNEHLNKDEKDRTNIFFAILFIFLSAMFMIVFSNYMIFMFCGWEITTVCSFLLIGYTKTPEAIKNSFRQININLLGGIAFAIAIYFCIGLYGTVELDMFLTYGIKSATACALPLFLFSFAGITKAAQMPFQSWLLGAMVAPTPTSALLHSSTMVKAGVFLLLKMSPIFYNSSLSINPAIAAPAIVVMLIGGISFLICSMLAISQRNAKRVLAYSTIANLGLIVACAGVGSPFAVWAGMFLILFHACAKSLLFLCVGTAEHHIGSRDIEDMDILFNKMPRLSRLMIVGMLAMFIAPFGMLISKWAALISFVCANQIALIIILAFGSAATFMFWAKWIGKLTGICASNENIEKTVHKSEWISQILMVSLIIINVILLPLISSIAFDGFLYDTFILFGENAINYFYQYGMLESPISIDAVIVCIATLIVIVIVLFFNIGKSSSKYKKVDVYLSGVNVNDNNREYKASIGKQMQATSKNMYLENVFGERLLSPIGNVLNIVLLSAAFISSLIMFINSLMNLF